MRSNLLERRAQLSNTSNLSANQLKLDASFQHFSHEVGNLENILAMTAGAGAFKFFRAGSLGLAAAPGSVLRALSYTGALFTEVSAFRGTHSLFERLHDRAPTQDVFDPQAFFSTFSDFLALKLAGQMALGHHPLLAHTLQSSAMVASRHLNASLGLTEKPQGNLLSQFVEASNTNLAMMGGLRLFGILSGHRIATIERSVDLQTEVYLRSAAHLSLPETESRSLLGMSARGNGIFRGVRQKIERTVREKVASSTVGSSIASKAFTPLVRILISEILRPGDGTEVANARVKLMALRVLLENTPFNTEEIRKEIEHAERSLGKDEPNILAHPLTEDEAGILYDVNTSSLADPRTLIFGRSANALTLLGLLEYYRTELTHALERARMDRLTGLLNRNHLDASIPKFERNLCEADQKIIRDAVELEAEQIETIESGFDFNAHIAERRRIITEEKIQNPSSRDWVIMVDIDHFKKENDTYGHANGDIALRHVAEIVQGSVRSIRGSGGDMVFRYGGEEMFIYLRDTDEAGVAAVAARMQSNLSSQPVTYFDKAGTVIASRNLTVTLGAARIFPTLNAEGDISYQGSITLAQRAADDALYVGKHNGRNRLVIDPNSQR